MYGRITEKTELSLPSSAKLNDGTWVSNYNLLPESALLVEGWKPITEVKPTYNKAKQYLEVDTAVDNGDTITVTYKVVDVMDYATELENLLLEEMGV